MFNVLKGIVKAAAGVVTIPVDMAADYLTLGGAINGRKEPYTVSKAKKIMDAVDEVMD